MKRSHFFILSIGILLASFYQCDRIENPIPRKFGTLNWDLFPGGDSADYDWPVWTTNSNTLQNVLLEDYTGHTCTNCPSAAEEATAIEDANGGRVVVVSVHASTTSGFQVPAPPSYPTDFRTPEGNEYATAMNISFNPAGTVNRIATGGNYFQFFSDWNNSVLSELTKSPKFNLQLQHNYFEQTNGLFVHTESEVLSDVAGDYNVVIMLCRKKVIAPQAGQGTTYYEYEHHNVFSGCINGTWGTNVVEGSAQAGSKVYNDYSFKLPDPVADTTYKIDNLRLMTFICNRDTYEVMQVIQTDLE
jgi:hypothetical protein